MCVLAVYTSLVHILCMRRPLNGNPLSFLFLPQLSCLAVRAASVVRQLLIHGAELEVANSDQQTPLDCAHSRVREALHHRRATISHKATGNTDTTVPQVGEGGSEE